MTAGGRRKNTLGDDAQGRWNGGRSAFAHRRLLGEQRVAPRCGAAARRLLIACNILPPLSHRHQSTARGGAGGVGTVVDGKEMVTSGVRDLWAGVTLRAALTRSLRNLAAPWRGAAGHRLRGVGTDLYLANTLSVRAFPSFAHASSARPQQATLRPCWVCSIHPHPP